MKTEQQVARHYERDDLEQAILTALTAAGVDIEHLQAVDLAGIDEFHLGGRPPTIDLAQRLGVKPGDQLLDIGSGIGGPARTFATEYGCRAIGIDLTSSFVATAKALTQRCGLADRVSFEQGSALAMPFADQSIDVATLIHVGMNIADKAQLFEEARRVLRPGGRFGIYDVMRMDEEAPIPYPVPWSSTSETSFVESPDVYRDLLLAAGFVIESERNRCAFVLDRAAEIRANAAEFGPPILGLHVIMGPAAKDRLRNVMVALEQGIIAPIEMIARVT